MSPEEFKGRGIEFVLDFFDCKCDRWKLTDGNLVVPEMIDIITRSGLTFRKQVLQEFSSEDGVGSYSFACILEESHLTGHAWPEFNYIALSAYVCHFNNDNTQRIIELVYMLEDFFKPARFVKKYVKRGEQ